jgi:hypothetical protein
MDKYITSYKLINTHPIHRTIVFQAVWQRGTARHGKICHLDSDMPLKKEIVTMQMHSKKSDI